MCANGYGGIFGDMLATRHRAKRAIDIEDKRKISQINEITGFTVLTVATESAVLTGEEYLKTFETFSQKYRPHSGSHIEGKHSFIRVRDFAAVYVTPVAWVSSIFARVIREAERYADSLGCSPDVTRDCECVVGVVFKARNNYDKDLIARYVTDFYGCTPDTLKNISKDNGTIAKGNQIVLLAVRAFLDSQDVESAVRHALALGNGSGAVATIAGSIAEAFYGTLPSDLWSLCHNCLDDFLDEVNDIFFMQFIVSNTRNETRLGGEILPLECPDEWKKWLVSICVDFTFYDSFALNGDLFKEYYKPTLYQSAIMLFRGENDDYIFPSYGVFTVNVVPAFEWWVSWPLLRKGMIDGITKRGKAYGAEGWDAYYQNTLIRLYLLPKYSNSAWCYVPSKGQLRLDVGGRTKEQAIENWHRLARPLRRILKQVRADLSSQRPDNKEFSPI